ncbi:MAG: hypothetical protein Homavirus42_3 [Homavirus sp.]|uniref:Uncharacterized protein n=1 Tax=Homavirus sp. TaxID=2487769 RepID=A0A3G5A556_9VIRU|nr:MAG: hypothetical protein Homavirus42_3 [Homavirus sp.]
MFLKTYAAIGLITGSYKYYAYNKHILRIIDKNDGEPLFTFFAQDQIHNEHMVRSVATGIIWPITLANEMVDPEEASRKAKEWCDRWGGRSWNGE